MKKARKASRRPTFGIPEESEEKVEESEHKKTSHFFFVYNFFLYRCSFCAQPVDSTSVCDGPDNKIYCRVCYGRIRSVSRNKEDIQYSMCFKKKLNALSTSLMHA